MGEKQIEVDRRRARERISRLQKQLEQIEKDKKEQRKARASELKVALVGYTNSGKTTLMKAMTKAKVDGKNALFATLDTNIKTLDPRTRPRILLSDTVGFIKNLPHSLIESFKSTLTEVLEADLLLIVVDVSYPKYEEHIETTRRVLDEIGAGDIPSLVVFNKADLLNDQFLPRILRRAYPGSITLSAGDPKGVTLLRDQVYEYFKANFVQATLRVPIGNHSAQSRIYNTCLILDSDFTQPGEAIFTIQTSRSNAARLAQMCLSG
jgi:GTP-binding protein HflX